MKQFQLLSRRKSARKVDFRPADPDGTSPWAQLRRLSQCLNQEIAPAEDLEGLDDALDAYREYLFRKVFSGTTHEEYMATQPERIDWLLAVAAIDAEHYRNSKKS